MINRARWVSALVGAIFFASPVPGIDSSTVTDKATPATTVELDHDDGNVIGGREVTWTCQGATGNCCWPNGTPGCNDFTCCNSVCEIDPYCCEVEWEQFCADWTPMLCDPDACDDCPGEGDCCVGNWTPGCEDEACCNTVCDYDPPCCNDTWDVQCAGEAENMCGDLCLPSPDCPGEGDCCVPNWTPACDNEACCNIVCAYDPPCCDDEWGVQCAGYAEDMCGDLCLPPPVCPGQGDCCEANWTPGCDQGCCCQVVCAEDRSCCDTAWDAGCAADAEALCPGWCSPPLEGCPGEGDCFATNPSPGCEDPFCCSLVCAADPYCCDDRWDSICAGEAADLCDCPEARCPGEGGPCCQANGTTGCDVLDCCEIVCADDPACCNPDAPDGWDAICVQVAKDLCGNLCACASFADFDDNGDVDLADFAKFQNCFTGSEAGPVADGCACANSDEDQDVDLTDFTPFYSAFIAE